MVSPEIIALRKDIEQRIGQSLQTPNDFQLLIQHIWNERHMVLSLSTIKRFLSIWVIPIGMPISQP